MRICLLLGLLGCGRSFLHGVPEVAAPTDGAGSLAVTVDSISPAVAGIGTQLTVSASATIAPTSCSVSIVQASADCAIAGNVCTCIIAVPDGVPNGTLTVTVTVKAQGQTAQGSATVQIDVGTPVVAIDALSISRNPVGSNDAIACSGNCANEAATFTYYATATGTDPLVISPTPATELPNTQMLAPPRVWVTATDAFGNVSARVEITNGADITPPTLDRSKMTFNSLGSGTNDSIVFAAGALGDSVFVRIDSSELPLQATYDLGDSVRDDVPVIGVDKCGNASDPVSPQHVHAEFRPGHPLNSKDPQGNYPRFIVSRSYSNTHAETYIYGGALAPIDAEVVAADPNAGAIATTGVYLPTNGVASHWENLTQPGTPAVPGVMWMDPQSTRIRTTDTQHVYEMAPSGGQWSQTALPGKFGTGTYDGARGVAQAYFTHDATCTAELWEFDGHSWRQGPTPPYSSGGQLVYDAKREQTMLMNGFTCGHNLPTQQIFVFADGAWRQDKDYPVAVDAPRAAYSVDYEVVFAFGGADPTACLDVSTTYPCNADASSLYVYNGNWAALSDAGYTPEGRGSATLFYDLFTGGLIVGEGLKIVVDDALGNVHLDWAREILKGRPNSGWTWYVAPTGITDRVNPSTVTDLAGGRVIVQSGQGVLGSSGMLAETWAYVPAHGPLDFSPIHVLEVALSPGTTPVSGTLTWAGQASGGVFVDAFQADTFQALGAINDTNKVTANIALTPVTLAGLVDGKNRLALFVAPQSKATGSTPVSVTTYEMSLTLDLVRP